MASRIIHLAVTNCILKNYNYKDKNRLELGYYLHLLQDMYFRDFVYHRHHWDPFPTGVLVGEKSKVLMLVNEDELISFCTYAEKDDIQPTALTPWIGFLYTFPQYRGYRYVGKPSRVYRIL